MRQHHDLDKPLGLLSAPRTRAQLQNEGFEAKETNKCPLLLQNVATSQWKETTKVTMGHASGPRGLCAMKRTCWNPVHLKLHASQWLRLCFKAICSSHANHTKTILSHTELSGKAEWVQWILSWPEASDVLLLLPMLCSFRVFPALSFWGFTGQLVGVPSSVVPDPQVKSFTPVHPVLTSTPMVLIFNHQKTFGFCCPQQMCFTPTPIPAHVNSSSGRKDNAQRFLCLHCNSRHVKLPRILSCSCSRWTTMLHNLTLQNTVRKSHNHTGLLKASVYFIKRVMDIVSMEFCFIWPLLKYI